MQRHLNLSAVCYVCYPYWTDLLLFLTTIGYAHNSLPKLFTSNEGKNVDVTLPLINNFLTVSESNCSVVLKPFALRPHEVSCIWNQDSCALITICCRIPQKSITGTFSLLSVGIQLFWAVTFPMVSFTTHKAFGLSPVIATLLSYKFLLFLFLFKMIELGR